MTPSPMEALGLACLFGGIGVAILASIAFIMVDRYLQMRRFMKDPEHNRPPFPCVYIPPQDSQR